VKQTVDREHRDSGRGSGNGKRLIQHHHGIRRGQLG
jgi:hypothetical protein